MSEEMSKQLELFWMLHWLDEFWEGQYAIKEDGGVIVHNSPKAVTDSYINLCNIIDNHFYSLQHSLMRKQRDEQRRTPAISF